MSNTLLSLLIGFLALDTTIVFQALISQPIFACSILGLATGNAGVGMEIGVMMQLLWINIVPTGASKFPEGNIASMVTCAIVLQFVGFGFPNLVFTLAFSIGIFFSYLGAKVTDINRKFNGRILDLTLKAVEKGHFSKITLLECSSILAYFIMMSTLVFFALTAASFFIPEALKYTPVAWEDKLALVKPAVWGMGIAITLPVVYKAVKNRS